MRYVTLALVAILACATPCLAQDRGLGVKGGVNLASQHTDGSDSSLDARTGLVAGAFWTLPLTSWLGVQVEGLYSMKGARVNFEGVKSTLQLDYFEVPVLARVPFGGGHRRYFVAGGPSLGLRLRARTRTKFSGATEDIDVADQVERLDVGIAGGGGVELGSLVIDARYTYGLTDIDKDEAAKTRNRAIAVTAGFRF